MGEDLEFTEEEMYFGGAQDPDENKPGLDNDKIEVSGRNEKLKRQRSALPDTIPEETPEGIHSPLQPKEEIGTGTPNSHHAVSSHFRNAGIASQSLTINRGRQMDLRHQKKMDPDEDKDDFVSHLGTSLPITIPGMGDPKGPRPPAHRKVPQSTDDFVPPHLHGGSMTSQSHSVNSGSLAKRDRLLQRNKILRRTGFLEGTALAKEGKAGSGALPELMDPLNRRLLPISESHTEQSALSAALGTPTKSGLTK